MRYALHRENRSRADDLVQDTLVRAISKQHLGKPGSNLRSWLFTLMHHQNVNDVHRSAVRTELCFDVEELHDNLASVNDTSASLQLRDLQRAMAKLPIRNRQVILLIALEDLSYEEAAEALRIPVRTVRSRLSRGRAELRQLMGMEERTVPAGNPERMTWQVRWPHSPAKSVPIPRPAIRATGVSPTVPTGLQGARLHPRPPTSTAARPIRAI
jgi:RNA polymerase sigma-70 factor, ECF subfamily